MSRPRWKIFRRCKNHQVLQALQAAIRKCPKKKWTSGKLWSLANHNVQRVKYVCVSRAVFGTCCVSSSWSWTWTRVRNCEIRQARNATRRPFNTSFRHNSTKEDNLFHSFHMFPHALVTSRFKNQLLKTRSLLQGRVLEGNHLVWRFISIQYKCWLIWSVMLQTHRAFNLLPWRSMK